MRRLVVAILALALGLLTPPAAGAEGEAWYWRWSDGSRADVRTVTVGGPLGLLPRVVVTVRPAAAGRTVTLQVHEHGTWRTEDVATTGRDGAALLSLNPFCEDGDWCDRRFAYRVVAGGRTAALSVRFGG